MVVVPWDFPSPARVGLFTAAVYIDIAILAAVRAVKRTMLINAQ